MNELVPVLADHVPVLLQATGERASYRFFEFEHTQRLSAYGEKAFDRLSAKDEIQLRRGGQRARRSLSKYRISSPKGTIKRRDDVREALIGEC